MSPIESLKRRLVRIVKTKTERGEHSGAARISAQLAAIESLESDAAALRKALEPFATEGDQWDLVHDDGFQPFSLSPLTVGDLRRAARALKGQP